LSASKRPGPESTGTLIIGVIADTHLREPTRELERVVAEVFAGADRIVHAGDVRTESVLRAFSGKNLVAVRGNNDTGALEDRLPEKAVFEAGRFRVGVTHGRGWPLGLPSRVERLFDDVDCIVFGHSHRAFNERRGGVLLFNPGAFCGGLGALGRRSVGILRVGREIHGEIVAI